MHIRDDDHNAINRQFKHQDQIQQLVVQAMTEGTDIGHPVIQSWALNSIQHNKTQLNTIQKADIER